MTLRVAECLGPARELAGDTLCLWCYSEHEIKANESPLLSIQDSQGISLPDVPLLSGIHQCCRRTNGCDWSGHWQQ